MILSVIIVEYHSIGEIRKCIDSLRAHISVPFEVIVSSNSCYNEQQKNDIGPCSEQVTWIFNERNGGFAYAMNEGLKRAQGAYLAIMNSDCMLEEGIDEMISFMDSHPEVGAIAPLMHDQEGNIQDTARPYVTLPRFIWRQTRRLIGRKTSVLNRDMDYDKIQTVDWIIGAFIMVSRKAYEATEGLDNRFFMYAEDLDWCTRIRQQGLEVVYFPKATVTYKGTRRARSNRKYAKIFIKSHFAYWRKFGFFWGFPKRKQLTFTDD